MSGLNVTTCRCKSYLAPPLAEGVVNLRHFTGTAGSGGLGVPPFPFSKKEQKNANRQCLVED